MTSPQQEFRKLLSLTQSYLLSEFKSRERIFSDPETYNFFKQYQPKAKPRQQQTLQNRQPATPVPKVQTSQLPAQPNPVVEQAPAQPVQQKVQPPLPPTAPLPRVPAEVKPPEATPREEGLKGAKNGYFTFQLEPITEVNEVELASIRKEIENLFPETRFLPKPPDDAIAKQIGQQWKQEAKAPEVVILSFQEHPDKQVFLQNMKTAINQRLAPCAIYSAQAIEAKQAWDKLFSMKELRLIVTTDYGMYSLPGLMSHYRESPEKSQRYLGGVPLLLLTDIAIYLKQPQLKAALWQALCSMLPKTQNS